VGQVGVHYTTEKASVQYAYALRSEDLYRDRLTTNPDPYGGLGMSFINFIKINVSAKTGMPYSFAIRSDQESYPYHRMGGRRNFSSGI